jgi:iron complex transport system substrate-binding protein
MAPIGLVLSASVTDPPDAAFHGRALVSAENLDLIDADVVLLTYNSPEAQTEIEANAVFNTIPAVKRGAYVALDLPTALAIAFPSALSIRYGLEQIVPKIRAAIA